jgi:hypothetical protein
VGLLRGWVNLKNNERERELRIALSRIIGEVTLLL